MRHIKFDESPVLREFAKIAGIRGMVKSASYELQQALLNADYGAGAANKSIAQRLAQIAKANPQDPVAAISSALQDPRGLGWMKQEQRNVLSKVLQPFSAQAPVQQNWPRRLIQALKASRPSGATGGMWDSLMAEVGKFQPNTSPEVLLEGLRRYQGMPEMWAVINQQLGAAVTKRSALGVENTKMAEEKLYDVTDETGEQLVEKAHPGGGTKTELTHSKTDENLVETIVEQQKRDVEVATKVPKGTYAALLNLADTLDKMGNSEAADKIDNILIRVSVE